MPVTNIIDCRVNTTLGSMGRVVLEFCVNQGEREDFTSDLELGRDLRPLPPELDADDILKAERFEHMALSITLQDMTGREVEYHLGTVEADSLLRTLVAVAHVLSQADRRIGTVLR